MREMEEVMPMNLYERKSLHSWVYLGNEPRKILGDTAMKMAGYWIVFMYTDAITDMSIR